MLNTVTVGIRDRARLSQVLAIAAEFGLDSLLARLGLREGVEESETADLPTRTRQALERLGPTYTKFGQILATRGDLLPGRWIAALEQLQSGAATLPFDELQQTVELSLGEPVDSAFAHFDRAALAAASLAQVHRARLHDGREVVVKIRRPGIRNIIEADLRLIRHLVEVANAASGEVRRFDPIALVDQLARDLLDELDFTQEGRNADLLRADFAGNDRVVIPQIHWQWCSEDILVMDYIAGIPPREPDSLRAAGIDPSRIAELGAELVLDMVLVNGRFHGDPHPGNLLCLPGDRLALLDLGSLGIISPRRQHQFLVFVIGLRAGDPESVADMLGAWSQQTSPSREKLLRIAERLVARHSNGPLVLNALVADFLPLLRHEGLALPPDLLLIFKAMVTMDGVIANIRPGFDLSHALALARSKMVKSQVSRLTRPEIIESSLLELTRIAADTPHLLRSASAWLDRQPQESLPPVAPAIAKAGWLVAGALFILSLAILFK